MLFKKISVSCRSDTSDLVAFFLHESGSMGEVFDDYNNIRDVLKEKRWDYADESLFIETSGCIVSGFFTIETDTDLVISSIKDKDELGITQVDVDVIDSSEWENEWKKYYVPFNIGKIVVIPEWIEHKTTCNELPVKLDPGLAFGTGTHETTSMCIDLMQKIDVNGKTVLDFGCGSGILGICAHKLGAKRVAFIDTDDQAITATTHNCALNGITRPEVYCCDVRDVSISADVIVANITADVLIAVEPLIEKKLSIGGYVIISGIIAQRAEAVVDTYKRRFTLVESQRKNEWSAYIFKL